jgi:hypothetical protein
MAKSPTLQTILDAAERRIKEGKGISHETFWKRVASRKRAAGTNGSGKKGKNSRRKS